MRTEKIFKPNRLNLDGSTIFEGDAMTVLARLPDRLVIGDLKANLVFTHLFASDLGGERRVYH